jgi:hypothetical protein
MSNDELVAEVNAVLAAIRLYPTPTLSIESPAKVAIPSADVLVVEVPAIVPAAGLFPMVSVTAIPADSTALPLADSTVTLTAGAMATPTTVSAGLVLNASWVGVATATVPLTPLADVQE